MKKEQELWVDAVGYEGLYKVSTFGNVFSLITNKIRKLQIHPDGYVQVELNKKGIYHMWKVHRLVAVNFIPNPDNKPEVNHKDRDKTNNRVSNLEWCTHEENKHHQKITNKPE